MNENQLQGGIHLLARKRNILILLILAVVVLLAAMGGFRGLIRKEPSAPSRTEGVKMVQNPISATLLYDPETLKVGDRLAGLDLIKIEKETYGIGSILSVWNGEVSVDGTYEFLYKEAAYNAGEVIFIPSAESAALLPQPRAFEGQAMRSVLHFKQSGDKEKFGPPGSRGTAELTFSSYLSVYAGILEGTSDSAEVKSVSNVQVTPPPSTEIQNADLGSHLKDFPVWRQTEPKSDSDSLRQIQEWINGVDSTFIQSSALSGKRIRADQRERIRVWLAQAFTETKALALLDSYAPSSEGGYLISGALSGLKPLSEIKELKDLQLVTEKDGSLSYKVTYVLLGAQDAYLSCKIAPVDSQWKIDAYTINYY
jgi:hypothetical protein